MAKFAGIWDGAPVALTDTATISLDAVNRKFSIRGINSGSMIEINSNAIKLLENISLVVITPGKLVFSIWNSGNTVDRAILDNEGNLSLADDTGYKRVELSSDGNVKAVNNRGGPAVTGHATDPKGSGVVGENSTIGATGFLGTAAKSQGKPIYCGVCGVSADTEEEEGSPVKGAGVFGSGGGNNDGVFGFSENGDGVRGESNNGRGLYGFSKKSDGVRGGTSGSARAGVYGSGLGACQGVLGDSENGEGVSGSSQWGFGVHGYSWHSWAGYFDGNVFVKGYLRVIGSKNFYIDHPLEPTTKYLIHSSVESAERLNLYSGSAILDANGEVWVDLPHWFEALNTDFRYQLTPIGGAAPNLHIAQEVEKNRFKIAGGRAKMKVSWQVTGTRNDAYAKAHPMQVEVEKEEGEKGTYLLPVEHGEPEEKGTHFEETRRRRESLERLQKELSEETQKAAS